MGGAERLLEVCRRIHAPGTGSFTDDDGLATNEFENSFSCLLFSVAAGFDFFPGHFSLVGRALSFDNNRKIEDGEPKLEFPGFDNPAIVLEAFVLPWPHY